MSVMTQLPPDLGGAAGKVCQVRISAVPRRNIIHAGSIYRHRRYVEWMSRHAHLDVVLLQVPPTRSHQIHCRQIRCERRHGPREHPLRYTWFHVYNCESKTKSARAFNSEHQVKTPLGCTRNRTDVESIFPPRWNLSTSALNDLPKIKILGYL
jgi:hypothetical protein